MPTPEFGRLGDNPTIEGLTDYIYKLQKELNYVLTALDDLNVTRLNAKVIVAGTITGDKVSANTITANKMSVTQLSAIAADLGSITAGTITGGTITGGTVQTAVAGNNRIVITGNKLETYNSADQLNGISWGVGTTTYGDVYFYDAGALTMEIANIGAGGGWTIRPRTTGLLRIGDTGKTVECYGIWNLKPPSDLLFNTATAAVAGTATLPANPVGFISIPINGTVRNIPYYAT